MSYWDFAFVETKDVGVRRRVGRRCRRTDVAVQRRDPTSYKCHGPVNQSINQSILEWPSGTATARSTAGVNVSNKSQETIDRIDVFSAFSGSA